MGGNVGSGQGNPIGNAFIRMGTSFGGVVPTPPTPARPGAAYQAPAANIYSPSFQTPAPQQMQPIRGIGPQQYPQLQTALNNILARYGQTPANSMTPQQPRPMMPMPQYVIPAYRPNMAPAQASLGRVAVSVAEQQRRAAQAELDRMRAEEQARQQQQFFGYWD